MSSLCNHVNELILRPLDTEIPELTFLAEKNGNSRVFF